MPEATFTELRNHAKAWFDLVEAGQTVRVLRHGKAIAEIRPILLQTPLWRQRPAPPLAIGGKAISQLILEARGN